MGNRFLRLALVYVLIGVALGVVMSASYDFTFKPVHVHVNLLGWASMFLFGLWYRMVPASSETRLAKVHFWLYNIAFPIQMVTLAMFVTDNKAVEPVLALASVAILVAFLCFGVNLWKHTRD
jgi:cbb3-type cytochrome oxidase subunit 1